MPADAENQNARTVNRLDAMAVFYGFRDDDGVRRRRRRAHLLAHSFCNTVTVHTAPTDNFDVFEDVVDDMRAGGQTAIYEAIEKACALLAPARAAHPAADLRVVCLSDGQNNCRRVGAEQALAALDALGATCDALLVGDSVDDALRRLVAATEGECFEIDCLARAFETLESPAVVSLAARRAAPKPAPRAATAKPRELAAVAPKPPRAARSPPRRRRRRRRPRAVDRSMPLAAFVARGDAGTRAGVQKRLAKGSRASPRLHDRGVRRRAGRGRRGARAARAPQRRARTRGARSTSRSRSRATTRSRRRARRSARPCTTTP